MTKEHDKFDHYLIRVIEHYQDLEFPAVIAVRLADSLTQQEQRAAIEEYVSGWRDSVEEVEQFSGAAKWTGPSGVVVELKAFRRIEESTWFLLREQQILHTVCL